METTTLINDVKYTTQVVELTISGEAMYVIICDNNSEGQLNFEIVTPLLKHKPTYDWLRFYHENFIKKSQIKFVGLN